MRKNKTKKIIFFLLLVGLIIFSVQSKAFAQGEESGDAALRGNPFYNPTTGTITNPDGTPYTGAPTSPGGTYQNIEKIPGSEPTSDFPTYVKQIIGFGFATIGILAMLMLCIGAYQYLMAAGNLAKVESAKETIASALLGLALGLTAWIILKTINPDLVKLELKAANFVGGTTSLGSVGSVGSKLPGPYTSNAPAEIQQKAKEYAAKYNVPESIALRMLSAESGGNPNAVSSRGAQGLLQLMPGTGRQYGMTDPFNVDQNLDAGYHYASDLYNKYGDWGMALAAYNMGPNGFDKYMNKQRKMPQETVKYVNKIMGSCNFCPT